MPKVHLPRALRLLPWYFLVLALPCGDLLAAGQPPQAAAAGAAPTVASTPGAPMPEPPGNLGRGLRPLLQDYHFALQSGLAEGDSARSAITSSPRVSAASGDQVLVDVHLNGSLPLAGVRRAFEAHGARITAQLPAYHQGLFSAWLPLHAVEALAHAPGVSAIQLAPHRIHRVGAVTSQGVVVHKTNLVNNSGYKGAGVRVGVLSDSFNDDRTDRRDPGFTTPEQDAASGDLPGPGNAEYPSPVVVVLDGTDARSDTDEGRAMLQIVHDVAPAAHLAFCTSGDTDAEFATNIGLLRVGGTCQVMCDDIGFDDEPMFSDGPIAQAVDAANAAGVSYFSAIGNDGNSGYAADFAPVPAATGQARAGVEGVRLNTISRAERAVISQWHAFATGTDGQPVVVQRIVTGLAPTTLIFQWDDPFDVMNNGNPGVTTDYDILVFNSAGTYLSRVSGVDDNISTNEPIELADLRANTVYKICIVQTTRTNPASAPQATHLRYLATDNTDAITGEYIQLNNPTAYGHACAGGCSGVAAYNYDRAPDPANAGHTYSPIVEGYSSNGPVTIYFDANGQRLANPSVRHQPLFSCTDNVDTSFFPPSRSRRNPYDYDNDGFPNFAGTSAAVPHAAGIAALLLDAAAVNNMAPPGPSEIRSILINTTQGQIDEDPLFSEAAAGAVVVTDTGDAMTIPNEFSIRFSGTTGQTLTSLTIDLSPDQMHFDTHAPNGAGFRIISRIGKPAPRAGHITYSGGPAGTSSMTIPLTDFGPGDVLDFSVGFDYDTTGLYGYDADEIAGASVSAMVSGRLAPVTGIFANQLGRAYNYKAGYGLLDAQAAVNDLLAP